MKECKGDGKELDDFGGIDTQQRQAICSHLYHIQGEVRYGNWKNHCFTTLKFSAYTFAVLQRRKDNPNSRL